MLQDTLLAVYWGGLFVLFFFWVYGLVSFAFDLKRRYIPAILQYRRGQRELNGDGTPGEEGEHEEEQHLY